MSTYTIEVEGLAELKARLEAGQLNKKVLLGMGDALRNINNELRYAVRRTYTIGRDLSVALVAPRTTSSFQESINLIILGLTYEGPRENLFDFTHFITPVPANGGRFNVPNVWWPDTKKGIILRKKDVEAIFVEVKRGQTRLEEDAFTGTLEGKRYILRRRTEKTWLLRPTPDFLEGMRAPYLRLKGPSLPEMAEEVYLHDYEVQNAKDNAVSIIASYLYQ